MINKLAASLGTLAVAVMLAVPSTQAQEHVRLMPQLGASPIESAVLSPDARLALTGGDDGTARLWDVATGEQIRSFKGHASRVNSVAFSPDGRSVLTGSYDNTARLWDVASGRELRTFTGHSNCVLSVAFSPDGRSVLTGSDDNTARLWDAASGRQIRSFAGHVREIHSVAFSPDGRTVLTGSEDKTARLWDAASGQQIRSFADPESGINSVAFSPDGRLVLTGAGNSARLWDAASGEQIRSIETNADVIESVAFSPDARSVLAGTFDGTVTQWDAATGQQIRSFAGKPIEAVSSGDPKHDIAQISDMWEKVVEGRAPSFSSVSFSRDGRLVLAGSGDQTAHLWDSATGEQIRLFEGHTDVVNSVAVSQDGRFLLTGSSDMTARLWDATTGAQIRSFAGHTKGVRSVAISVDDRFALTYGDTTMRLWDAATGKQIHSFPGYEFAAISRDDRLVATGGTHNEAELWDAATGKQIRSFIGPHTDSKDEEVRLLDADVWAVALSPDGRTVLTGSGGIFDRSDFAARLWDVASGRLIRTFIGHTSSILSATFSPDGSSVLTGSDDNTARLWDVATGQQIRVFKGHTERVTSVAFSPDGRSVLTGSWDNTARLWDAATGQQIRIFAGDTNWITSVAFSPDGRHVFTGSSDTTTRLWDAASGKQLATLLSFDNGGWAVTDPKGRYDANDPDNTPGLVWVADSLRTIELKQLKDNYFTPNLLASILKGERLPEVKGLDLVPAPPAVAIASSYKPESKRLVLSIEDQGGGIGRLVVSVNDRKVAVLEHSVAGDKSNNFGSTDRAEVAVDLSAATLQPGENTISAYAYDAGNQIRSHEAVASFSLAASSKGLTAEVGDSMLAEYKPQFYAILVGTASFPGNHAMDLLYPAHDAESMMTGVEIGAGNLFGKENVHLRLLTTDAKDESAQPTKANIAAAFAEVMKKAKPTDVMLVYFSGHGVGLGAEKDGYYYLTADARNLEIENNPALRQLSTVSSAELRQWLGAKNMPLKEVLILDTCAAGAANEELLKLMEKRDVPPDQRRAVEFLKDATGTVILMGAAADKVSYEASRFGQGLLTYALLEGMRGRAVGEGGQLNVSRWFQNASEEVPLLAQSIGGIQKPQIAAPQGVGFPVALLGPSDESKIPLAAIKPELLHLTCHNEDDEDPLGLAQIVREQLREISHPSVRGQQTEPPIVYLDDLTDGPADSLTPKIVYSVQGDLVSLRLRIDQAGKTLQEERLNLGIADTNALANAVAAKLIDLAGQVPLKGATP
jgi:WD40 repeat protein